jgi:4'-phosphopantetheinyl transferase
MGKPEIKDNTTGLRFNLSHNDELIVCAICLNNDIGCDVENLSRKINVNAIAKRFFSTQEAQLIAADPGRFFEYWTLKEAFVKATGLGISQGLETFSFHIRSSIKQHINDNIELSFHQNCSLLAANNWYQALIFPDNKHCIGLSFNNQKQVDIKPNINLFALEKASALFTV